MTTVIIYNSGGTQKPFSVASTVAFEARKHDSNVAVLDVENFTYIHQGLPPAWYARLFGYEVYSDAFQKYLQSIDVGYHKLEPARYFDAKPKLPVEVDAELEDAIKSDLFTYFRTDSLDDHPILARYLARKMREKSAPVFHVLVDYFRHKQVDTVFIPNGRVGHQRLALLAAQQAGCDLMFFEIGRAVPDSAYIGTSQIHDREKSQVQAKSASKQLTRAEKKMTADEWLSQRMKLGSRINIFSKMWVEPAKLIPPLDKESGTKSAVLFTSSADEFSSYGERWSTQKWSNQFEAFALILELLGKKGIRSTLRIHPNLVNKSRHYVKREIRYVRQLKRKFPGLRIITPTDSANSYSLLVESDYIIVGRSTLGLEASLMGKCVWTTTPARYDEIADVRKIHQVSDATEENLDLWPANPRGAQDFVAYWVSQDYPFTSSDRNWCSWSISEPPLVMKIGNLLIENGFVHKLQLILWELKRELNRREFRRRNPLGTSNSDSPMQKATPHFRLRQ